MLPLLEKCVSDNDFQSWDELWKLFHEAAAHPIRQVLRRCGFPRADFDEVVMEIWVHLLDHERSRLFSFRGATEGQLRVWMKHVAAHFTQNWVDKQNRAARRQRALFQSFFDADRAGPCAHDILDDFLAAATNKDRLRLRILAGLESPVHRPSARTCRRWRQDLRDKYDELT